MTKETTLRRGEAALIYAEGHQTPNKRTFETMFRHSLDEFAGRAGHNFKIDTWTPLSTDGQRRRGVQPGCGFE